VGLALFGLAADAFRKPLYFLVPTSFALPMIVWVAAPIIMGAGKGMVLMVLSGILSGASARFVRSYYSSREAMAGEHGSASNPRVQSGRGDSAGCRDDEQVRDASDGDGRSRPRR
jgi:hypothetical protein